MCRCFREIERVDYIMEVLTRCRHNGFPVVRSSLGDDEDSGDFDAAGQGASRSGSLQGLILRSQILVMLRHQVRLLGHSLLDTCAVRLVLSQNWTWQSCEYSPAAASQALIS